MLRQVMRQYMKLRSSPLRLVDRIPRVLPSGRDPDQTSKLLPIGVLP